MSRTIAMGSALCAAILVAPGVCPAGQSSGSPVERDIESLILDLETSVPDLMEKAHVPGLSMAVVRDGNVVWSGGFGVKVAGSDDAVTVETIFEAASLTKPLFAYTVMRLVDEDLFDLDRPLVNYVPGSAVRRMVGHSLDRDGFRRDWLEKTTARHVLSHSSGFPHGERRAPLYPLFFEPGDEYKYSAEGYGFLQMAIEYAMDRPLDKIVAEYVFDPLEMRQSSLVWRDAYAETAAHGHDVLGTPQPFRQREESHAAASLYTTASDYARFVAAVLNGEGLGPRAQREMLDDEVEVDDHLYWSLGFGLQRDDDRGDAIWQWGDYGIFRNFVIGYPEEQVAVVYLTNSFYGLGIAPELVTRTVGGPTHALAWLDYASYDSPASRFTWAMIEDGPSVATELLTKFREDDPDVLHERDVNLLGYQFLFAQRFDDAIALFQLNVKDHPRSANAQDSLGEGYMFRAGAGDIGRAINAYRKAIELLPDDPVINDQFRDGLKRNAEEKLQELESKLERS